MPIFDFECKGCGNKFDLMIANKDKDKGSSRNKQGRIRRGFFALDKASKRSNTGCIRSFDNEV